MKLTHLVCALISFPFVGSHVLGADDAAPLFSRHVVPIFSKLGCNAGLCHGSVQGKGGFRLSLFGVEPARDHDRLLRELGGRRLNLFRPADSLLLTKAAGLVRHEGGRRTSVGSPEYQIILNWIRAGHKLDDIENSRLKRLQVTPASHVAKPKHTYQLKVTASFADGSQEDVTSLCTFDEGDRVVARVDGTGTVTTHTVGDTAVIARYRGVPIIAQVTVVPEKPEGQFPKTTPHNFIDEQILKKLEQLDIPSAPLCDDATFLKRVSLDVAGALPTPDEVRAFLASKDPDKRAKKIDELLSRPGYASLWALKFLDYLSIGGYRYQVFKEDEEQHRAFAWLKARFAENIPYDELAERVLTATSREGKSQEAWADEVVAMLMEGPEHEVYSKRRTLDLFWQRDVVTDVDNGVRVAHAFLGLRMQCAQCHRHPFDVWTQEDLLSFSNFFIRLPELNRYPKRDKEFEVWVKGRVKKLDAHAKDLQQQARKAEQQFKPDKQKLDEARKKLGDLRRRLEQAKADAARSNAQAELDNLQKAMKPLLEKEQAVEAIKERASLANTAKGKLERRLGSAEVFLRPDDLMRKDRETSKILLATVSSPLGTQSSDEYRLLGAKIKPDVDPRQAVADWFRQPDNPYFARAIANRVWSHYFGRGIIDPPDQMSPLNPASHPQLLAKLSAGFIQNKFDLKWLHRMILNSRTYQQSSQRSERNRFDQRNYAVFYLRRMPAELVLDAIDHATDGVWTRGNPERFVDGGLPNERDASELGLRIFGRPTRNPEVVCDCERANDATMVQSLFVANYPEILKKIEGRKAYGTHPAAGRVREIIAMHPDSDERQIEEVFLWTLARLPGAVEQEACATYLKSSTSREAGLQGILWGLLNTHEFLYIH